VNVRTFYRAAIWLPIAVPAAVVGATHAFAWSIDNSTLVLFVFQILASSLIYGGIPYFVLAVWGSVALQKKSEAETERLMQLAPLS
jgi:hypothetical protein